MFTENQTVNGEQIRTVEIAKHYHGILQLPNSCVISHVVELHSMNLGMRLQVDGILWGMMRSRDSRKQPQIGILYDDDALHGNGPIPLYLQAWSDGDSITPKMAIFGKVRNGAFLSPKTFYSITRGGVYTSDI